MPSTTSEEEKTPVFPLETAGSRYTDLSDGWRLGTRSTGLPTWLCYVPSPFVTGHVFSHIPDNRDNFAPVRALALPPTSNKIQCIIVTFDRLKSQQLVWRSATYISIANGIYSSSFSISAKSDKIIHLQGGTFEGKPNLRVKRA